MRKHVFAVGAVPE